MVVVVVGVVLVMEVDDVDAELRSKKSCTLALLTETDGRRIPS